MTDQDKPISLREAAELAGVKPRQVPDDMPEKDRPSNQPGASATAALDTMLAASRKGKRVG